MAESEKLFVPIKGADPDDPADLLWGAKAIGDAANRTAKQIYHLHACGKLAGAVRNFDGILVGSRRALRQLILGVS